MKSKTNKEKYDVRTTVGRILTTDFFNRPTVAVARDLIGCYIVRRRNGKDARHMITETEAYDGEKDLACHASKGRTKRTEVLFGKPGILYIYFTYGMHWLLNVVTGPEGYAAGVLIRSVEETNGPARLTKKLNITGKLHSMPANKKSGLWFEERNPEKNYKIVDSSRIGVAYAGPVWSKKKWRFVLKDSKKDNYWR